MSTGKPTMPTVVRVLLQEHANISLLLKSLQRQIDAFASGGNADLAIIRDILDYCQSFPETCHHPKEESILQQLRQRAPEAAREAASLEQEHRDIGAATTALLQLLDRIDNEEEVPRDALISAVRAYMELYKSHMATEERTLFMAAAKRLSEDDWTVVGDAIYASVDPLFGENFSERFASLRRDIQNAS